jgi:hypothetical protein
MLFLLPYETALPLIRGSLILWLMKWGPYPRSLLDAIVMNITSGFLGTFLSVLTLPALVANTSLSSDQSVALTLVLHGFMTLLMETAVLLLLRRKPLGKTFSVALVANLVSYSCLSLVLLAMAF